MAVSPIAPRTPHRGAERARTGRLIHESLGLLSSKWAVDVLLALGDGTRRYHQLLGDLEPISEKVLTQTLRAMERDGLVGRRVHPEVPPRVEYALTPLGASLAVPLTRSAAAAASSAIAITEAAISRPSRSGRSRQSASGARPALPIATSTWPWRQALPHESVTITAPTPSAARSAAAERSGSSGRRTTASGAPAFERSTPAFAHVKPWRVRQMSRPRSARRSSAVSSRMAWTWRGSLWCSAASARARSPGSTAASARRRPSALEPTLWATASTSPGPSGGTRRAAAVPSSAARSSPGRTSGSAGSGSTASAATSGGVCGGDAVEQRPRPRRPARARRERAAQRGEVAGGVDVEPERGQLGDPARAAGERP